MKEVAEDIMRELKGVRYNKISIAHARETVEQRAHSDRQTIRKESDGLILLDALEDSANAYLNLIKENPEEPISKVRCCTRNC